MGASIPVVTFATECRLLPVRLSRRLTETPLFDSEALGFGGCLRSLSQQENAAAQSGAPREGTSRYWVAIGDVKQVWKDTMELLNATIGLVFSLPSPQPSKGEPRLVQLSTSKRRKTKGAIL
jgi:hypothetical protein